MMSRLISTAFAATLMLLIAVSCAGGSAGPQQAGSPLAPPVASENLQLTGQQDISGESAHYLWALYQIFVDPARDVIELVPQRLAGDHFNVLKFLEQGPCANCVAVVNAANSDHGTKLFDIRVRHPFPDAKNLTGFDVRGIALFRGSSTFPISGLSTPDRTKGDGELVNADGCTTLYNSTTVGMGPGGLQGYQKGKFATAQAPNALLNGFKRFRTSDPANTRNAFYSGDQIIVTYDIDMPDTAFILGYAVDANWAPPLVKPVTDPMTQFGPEANCPEPWQISVSEAPIGDGLTDQGGQTVLTLDVYDWQGKNSHFAPEIECADLFDGIIKPNWQMDGPMFARYQVTISNSLLAPIGTYKGLISVEDSQNIGSPDWLDLTAYQIYTFNVIEYVFHNQLPVAKAKANPTEQTVCLQVHFTDDGSYDPDGGAITLYEWDWDNDGTFDEQGADVYHTWDTPGIYYVQFRVTDDDASTDTLDTPIEITVTNALPTAEIETSQPSAYLNEPIDFDGSGSHDNDCNNQSIVKYEWDWDDDGVYDEEGAQVTHSWSDSGIYPVQLQVTDDEGGTDTLDSPLMFPVEVEEFPPIAYAKAEPNPQTVCEPVHFADDGSYDPDGGLIQVYEWDWNNDGIYDEQGADVYHTWDKPGKYSIQFRVTDDEGVKDILESPLEITIENALPTAAATADKYDAGINEAIHFDGSGSTDNDCQGEDIVLWEWDWTNDGTYEDAGVTADHSYPMVGTYHVQLRVTDDEGGMDMLDTPLEIGITSPPVDPIAYAKAEPNPQIICEVVHFTDDGSFDPDGGLIQLYEWDWDNDGTFDETGADVNHTWDTPGDYQVQFRVTDDEAATDTLASPLEIVINNALPTASAVPDKYEAAVDETINFDGSGSTDNDCGGQSIVQWEWDWTSDGTYEDTGVTASHSYSEINFFHVQLRVTDNEGGTDTLDTPLEIAVGSPVKGWNPVPGLIGLPVDNPAPNQSTYVPDLGIQNDGAGTAGAWLVDQAGGIPAGSPRFYDYLLDWTGPGGHTYASGFNFSAAPLARHDVTGNGIGLFGCFGNTGHINSPVVNDPFTAIWYLIYLKTDESLPPGSLVYVRWGDAGAGDPPGNDPDAQPWFHTADVSAGMPGQQGDPLTFSPVFLMTYSHAAGAPAIANAQSGALNVGFWAYPYFSSNRIWRLGFPDFTTDMKPSPPAQAFDVSDPTKCRMAADTDSYLTFDQTVPGTATMVYMLDSLGNWYGGGFQVTNWTTGAYSYVPLANTLKIRTDDATYYIPGATAVDLEMLPTIVALNGGDPSTEKNWCAVLFDDHAGHFIIRVYRIDWTVNPPIITIVDTTDPIAGTPLSLDVDPVNFRIHVLAKVGGTIKATVFRYIP